MSILWCNTIIICIQYWYTLSKTTQQDTRTTIWLHVFEILLEIKHGLFMTRTFVA